MRPLTRFYAVRKIPHGPWARIWITDDGCFTTISDHGNFGYWWGSAGCEFRQFLCGLDDDYLSRKLAFGQREFDGEESVKSIRRRIVELRRQQILTRLQAEEEWWLVHPKPSRFGYRTARFSDMHNEIEAHDWYQTTHLHDAAELLVYRTPLKVQMFVKHVWPLFVEQLRAELAAEAGLFSTPYDPGADDP